MTSVGGRSVGKCVALELGDLRDVHVHEVANVVVVRRRRLQGRAEGCTLDNNLDQVVALANDVKNP